jgi:hypothetical protein
MAHKRRIVVTIKGEDEPPPFPLPEEKGWRDWFRQTYAKYWFAIISLFIDVMVSLTLADMFGGISIPLFSFIALIAVEVTIYLRIWGMPPWTD